MTSPNHTIPVTILKQAVVDNGNDGEHDSELSAKGASQTELSGRTAPFCLCASFPPFRNLDATRGFRPVAFFQCCFSGAWVGSSCLATGRTFTMPREAAAGYRALPCAVWWWGE